MLFSRFRRRPLLPHRLLVPVIEQLRCLAEFCDAIGASEKDPRWNEAATSLYAAVEVLTRRP